MKVLNLRCANGHGFEGWFASEDDFLDQNGQGLIECPMCADRIVTRMPSAPRLNLSGAREPVPAPATAPTSTKAVPDAPPTELLQQLQAAWLHTVHQVMKNTEDVGERFAEEARRIHYGESEERGIRGQTTPEEREALSEEGIEVMSLPIPPSLKGPVQ